MGSSLTIGCMAFWYVKGVKSFVCGSKQESITNAIVFHLCSPCCLPRVES